MLAAQVLVRSAMALSVLVSVSTGCSLWQKDSVAVIGDSITALGGGALDRDLGDRVDLQLSGNFGETVAQVLPKARDLSAQEFDQVFINLGTNDVLQDLPVPESMQAMQEMVALFEQADCVHLVTINEHMVHPERGSVSEGARRLNEAMVEFAETDERVRIVDWNAVASNSLDGSDPPTSTLTDDSIHPTDEGFEQLDQLYLDALDDCG